MVTVIKMGGGPNPPVQLGPGQRIINVSWAKITHIAFSIRLTNSATEGVPGMCWPAETDNPGGDLNSGRYLASLDINFFRQSSIYVRRKDEWQTGSASVSGIPTGLSFEYDAFEIGSLGSPIDHRMTRFQTSGGSGGSINVPDTELTFIEGATVVSEGVSYMFTSEPQCFLISEAEEIGAFNAFTTDYTSVDGYSSFSTTAFPLSAITATVGSRIFRPIGAKTIENLEPLLSSGGGSIDCPTVVWLLCAPETES